MKQHNETKARSNLSLMAMDVADASVALGADRLSSLNYYLFKIEQHIKELREVLADEDAAVS
jgi:hypothetical protein